MRFDDALEGAAIGAGVALVIGQLGPQAAIPEEIVTVPTMAIAGALLGSTNIKKVLGL